MGWLMEHVETATDAFLVVGIKTQTTNRIEAVPQTAKIPALWERFFADDVSGKIPERLPDPAVYAVYTDYESADRGRYLLMIGHKVRTLDRTPKGLGCVLVPSARYLRFPTAGQRPKDLVEAWTEIHQFFECSHEFERTFTTDFEIHNPSDTEIYVAVKSS